MRVLAFLLFALGMLSTAPVVSAEELGRDAFVRESRSMVKTFAASLKGELQAAIKEGGPMQAIEVCSIKAPEIARDLSQSPEWTVARTSHKLRNPDNAPDAWESMVLNDFLQRAAAGESLKTMERAELVESDGGRTFRYMKAIPVGDVCLACHGSDIAPELKAKIDSFYPADKATGFAVGELRGAFTLSKALAD